MYDFLAQALGHGSLPGELVSGSRITSISFQVDETGKVDPWRGIAASNQDGIASVDDGLITIAAIEQFSMQSGGEADQRRNAGGAKVEATLSRLRRLAACLTLDKDAGGAKTPTDAEPMHALALLMTQSGN